MRWNYNKQKKNKANLSVNHNKDPLYLHDVRQKKKKNPKATIGKSVFKGEFYPLFCIIWYQSQSPHSLLNMDIK